MKRIFLVILCLPLFFLDGKNIMAKEDLIRINNKNFPDLFFQTYIKEKYDKDGDGKLSKKERKRVLSISVGEYSDYQLEYEYPPVESLQGIEFFPELKYINCSGSSLDSLDVTKNTKLRTLICNSNELKRLDVSSNKNLEMLNCSENKIAKLTLKKNRNLIELFCGENRVKKLDVSRNEKLKVLSIEKNKLKKISVTKLKKLQSLTCSFNEITRLNLRSNRRLDTLYCTGNKLKKLDLRNNKLLQYLYCQSNQLIDGNCFLTKSQLSSCESSPQKQTIRVKKIGKYYYIPIKGINRTNEITNLSAGVMTEKGIRLKGKKLPKKITYEYNMFTDGEKKTKVEIKVKK